MFVFYSWIRWICVLESVQNRIVYFCWPDKPLIHPRLFVSVVILVSGLILRVCAKCILHRFLFGAKMETLKKDGENKKEFNDSGVQDGKNPIDIEQYLFSIFFCSFVFVYMQIIIGRKKT